MPYKVSCGLFVADKKVNYIINNLIKEKVEFVKIHLHEPFVTEYSRTVHTLDLLQYYVVRDTKGDKEAAQYELKLAKEQFELSKHILDKKTVKKIQYCIDILEAHVLMHQLSNNEEQ